MWDWPEKGKLENLTKNNNVNLKLFWLQDQNQLKEVYKQATIFCLPSKNEWVILYLKQFLVD